MHTWCWLLFYWINKNEPIECEFHANELIPYGKLKTLHKLQCLNISTAIFKILLCSLSRFFPHFSINFDGKQAFIVMHIYIPRTSQSSKLFQLSIENIKRFCSTVASFMTHNIVIARERTRFCETAIAFELGDQIHTQKNYYGQHIASH